MATSAAIHPKGARAVKPHSGAAAWVESYLTSSIGRKILVALTGLLLAGFVVAHLIGNLKMFSGPESINKYAAFLKHDIGLLLWIARGGLVVIVLAHIFLAIRLQMAAAAARPIAYSHQRSAQATAASKTMIWTGLAIAAFIALHLAHYTFGIVHEAETATGTVNYHELKDAKGQHDVYRMVISGFTTWWISAIYIISQILLFIHLSHGLQSSFRTLGLVGKRFEPAAKLLGYSIATGILAGNLAIVVAVWIGMLE